MITLSSDGLSFRLIGEEMRPDRPHMEEPFELLQIAYQPDEELTASLVQVSSRGAFYAAFPRRGAEEDLGAGLLHTHDYYEILCVLDGEIYQNIDAFRHYYRRGSCCIVSPDVPHSEEVHGDTEARLVFLKLHPDYVRWLTSLPRHFGEENTPAWERIREYFGGDDPFVDFIPAGAGRAPEEAASLLDSMARELFSPGQEASLSMGLLICRFLRHLFDEDAYGNTPVAPGTGAELRFFREIRSFMENSPRRVTRRELEEHFHYSGDYLYKIVRRYTGLSIGDYAKQIAMKRAAVLCRTTELRIQEIAESVGFRNCTQFYRDFEACFHKTPAAYRREG